MAVSDQPWAKVVPAHVADQPQPQHQHQRVRQVVQLALLALPALPLQRLPVIALACPSEMHRSERCACAGKLASTIVVLQEPLTLCSAILVLCLCRLIQGLLSLPPLRIAEAMISKG